MRLIILLLVAVMGPLVSGARASTYYYYLETQFGDRILFFRQDPVSIPGTIPAAELNVCDNPLTCSSLGFTTNGTFDRLSFNYVLNGFPGSTAYFFNAGAFSTPGAYDTVSLSFGARLFVGQLTNPYLYIFSEGYSGMTGILQLDEPISGIVSYLSSLDYCRAPGSSACSGLDVLTGIPNLGDEVSMLVIGVSNSTYEFPRGTFRQPGVYANGSMRLLIAQDPFAVPEPGTLTLTGAGVAALIAWRTRRVRRRL